MWVIYYYDSLTVSLIHLGPIHHRSVFISLEVQLQEVVVPPANLELPERPGFCGMDG